MNLIWSSPMWLIAVLVVALVAAVTEDIVRLRISNLTCGAVFLAALVAMALHGFSKDLWQNAVVCIVILLAGLPLFARGWIGGGDVKLLAAVGLWLDIQGALHMLAAVFASGGVVALFFILIRRIRRDRSRQGIPYGIAIVFGAMMIFGMQLHQRSVARFPWEPGYQGPSA